MTALINDYGAALVKAIGIHTVYVLVSVAIGFALGLVLGVLLSRIPQWSGVILPLLSIFQTIPGLVFIGVLFIWWGMVYPTVIVALSVYAMFPVLKNTYTGILGVEGKYLEAARGCGMSAMQALVPGGAASGHAHDHRRAADVHHLHRLLGGAGGHDRPGRPG